MQTQTAQEMKKLEEQTTKAAQKDQGAEASETKSRWWLWLIIVAVVVALAIGVYYLVFA